MSQRSRKEYLEQAHKRYVGSGLAYKSRIIDEFCLNCGYERKYAIKLLNRGPQERKRKPGPESSYGREHQEVLERLWFDSDQMNSKRLKEAIKIWLPFYEIRYGAVTRDVRQKLLQVSPRTIDRLLKPFRIKYQRRRRCGTKPGSIIRTEIPIRAGEWQENEPGYLEADTVAHCGGSLSGSFIWSVTYTDILTQWTEIRAVWNKGSADVLAMTKDVENRLPFEIKGFDSDNGGEFLNYHLKAYFHQRERKVFFTRSREYHKNDNAHVEQKNWSHVRELLGYDRLDNPEVLPVLNDMYRNEYSLMKNFFCPSTKLVSKKRIKSKYIKKYDKPITPYQRIMACDSVPSEKKKALKTIMNSLNPYILKETINSKLKRIFKLQKQLLLDKSA